MQVTIDQANSLQGEGVEHEEYVQGNGTILTSAISVLSRGVSRLTTSCGRDFKQFAEQKAVILHFSFVWRLSQNVHFKHLCFNSV